MAVVRDVYERTFLGADLRRHEGYGSAVGRPLRVADGEISPGQSLLLSRLSPLSRLDLDRPEMRISEIGVDDDGVEFIFLAFFAFDLVFRRVARDEGEMLAVGRPLERLDVVIFTRHLVGLAAVYGDDPDLSPFVAVSEERDVRPVRGPFRRSFALVAGGQFRRGPAVR